MKDYKDFDAMFSEMQSETVPFKAFGKMYSIPKRIPASVVLELARKEKSKAMSTDFMLRAARLIFGGKTLDALCEHPEFSVDMLGEMLKWAFEAINGKADDGDEVTEDDTGVRQAKN